ncbi:DNA adenine methylase [Luteimonas gilva]|uniref:DNA adenine methylase n=1 Tax=Luteimonas gilva TaxID=2572684 RepID=A0A4U5JM77_9GAMM|nr:DNA adenine methylase [Luteimonas gilva]TKR30275.1 DNA adenine methylase [Luteimonas gilva]
MRYPGGKGRSYPQLINLMPRHTTYVETHLGSGAVMRRKRRAERQIGIEIDPSVIAQWRAQGPLPFELVEADAVIWLGDSALDPGSLIYVDPPYLPSTRKRQRVYRFDYTERDHERLLATLLKQQCHVMVSGYSSSLYDYWLRDWNRRSFLAKAHDGLRQEVVWFNFEPPVQLHDPRHLGRNFREREVIFRRRERLTRRIDSLSPHEQHALLHWLQEKLEV